ncbi:MAG: arginine deiminase [Muribaculaceae bacterium]|nr:arginine deiminase [Muribaculaceae bacterium]MBQ2235833.1 arginine deiminase [Muribaculaceae bacterium]MBQ4006585.1 arginine deiminase [Muribaculaceae bacterium]
MKGIHVTSEIMPLKKVLLHRPGRELLNLTPNTLEELLFDDIPYLKVAEEEHDAFSQLLRDNGVEVVYLEDLVAEVLDISPGIRRDFLRQFIAEAGVRATRYHEIIYDYLDGIASSKELVLKTMEGVYLNELPRTRLRLDHSLVDQVHGDSRIVVNPMPNLYFTRDPFASIGTGVAINRMYSVTRCRETIYADYLFKYHPDFKDVEHYYDRFMPFHIEGGDVLNLSEHTLAVGISQRTEPDAIELLAKKIFKNRYSSIDTLLAIRIPETRAFMHLDTVFTQIDYDKFMVHPGILGPIEVFKITPGDSADEVRIARTREPLEQVLAHALGTDHVELIKCGGGDRITAEREQWNDGSNTLCIAPGKVIVYERNDVTNAILRNHGLTVLEIPSSELSRGRGGPRCMSMPLCRQQ